MRPVTIACGPMVSTMQRSPALAAEHAVVMGRPDSVAPEMATVAVAPDGSHRPEPDGVAGASLRREERRELLARVGYGVSVQSASSPIPSGILPRG